MKQTTPEFTSEHLDAINQLFAEFRLAYHNQFLKAFPNDRELMLAKQLWLHALADVSPARIRAGVRRAIRASEYLPTIHSLRNYCDPKPHELGIPDAHAAYVEACRAPQPKQAQAWSHPIVYHAGRESDWFLLANSPESVAFPVYKRNYELLIERLLNGESLDIPVPKGLPEEIGTPLTLEERKQRLQQMRATLGI
jgi:hypothetical protein